MRAPSVVVRPPPTEAPTGRSLPSGIDPASRGVWAASAAIRRSPTIRYSPTSGRTSAPTARTATRPTTANAAAIRDDTRSGIGDQAIADAPDGLDRGAIRTELLSKLRDMNVDGPGLTRVAGAPHALQR